MSAYRVGQVGFAILGVYMVILAIAQLPGIAFLWKEALSIDSPEYAGLTAFGGSFSLLFYLAAGYLVTRNHRRLAEWAVGKDVDEEPGGNLGLAMAYSVVGVYVIIEYGSELVGRLPNLFSRFPDTSLNYATAVAHALGLLLGLFLFFRSESVARFWSATRSAGTRSGNATPTDESP